MERILLTAETTATDLDDVFGTDRKIETLDESFRRCRQDMPVHADPARHSSYLFNFRRATAYGTQRPHEALKIVEINAAWCQAKLDEIEADWSAEMDRLLAAFVPQNPEASTMTYEEWNKAMKSLEISCGMRRTNATKAAYGITYAEFVAE